MTNQFTVVIGHWSWGFTNSRDVVLVGHPVCRIRTLDVLQAPHQYSSSRRSLHFCTRLIDNIVNGTIPLGSPRAEEEAWQTLSTRAYLSSMTLDEFQGSFQYDDPTTTLSLALTASWWDGKANGPKLTNQRKKMKDRQVRGYAYLHRKEGDLSNAAYWYQRAGKSPSRKALTEEWNEITCSLLG